MATTRVETIRYAWSEYEHWDAVLIVVSSVIPSYSISFNSLWLWASFWVCK